MHPSSLISYYPTYSLLDEIVSYDNYKTINIFMDFKNIMQSVYMEHAIINIVETSKQSSYIDTSVFSSLISFLSFHKIYSHKRGIKVNFTIFFETGQSYYHKNIDKNYKISRRIDDLYGLDREDRDLFFSTLHANYQLVEKACNKMPDIRVIRLPNLEADFIPYYTTTRGFVKKGDGICNLLYSNDHDMWQCLDEHFFIYSKAGKYKKIMKAGKVMEYFAKTPTTIPDEYLPLAMAVCGDPGDDVTGVKGVGPKTFLKIFDELVSLTGNIEEIYTKVINKEELIDPKKLPSTFVNKKLQIVVEAEIERKVITKNLQLVSYELISRMVEDPVKTDIIDKRNIIHNQFTQEREIVPSESMKIALQKNNVFLEDSSIDLLYI